MLQFAASPFKAFCFQFRILWRSINLFLIFWNASLHSCNKSFNLFVFMSILCFRSSNVVHAASPSAIYRKLTAFFSAIGASAPPISSLFSGVRCCIVLLLILSAIWKILPLMPFQIALSIVSIRVVSLCGILPEHGYTRYWLVSCSRRHVTANGLVRESVGKFQLIFNFFRP